MTGTADGGDGDAAHPLETSDAQAYFRAVESAFLALRGAPLLLSPSDWRVARAWFEAGVPLELVGETMRELYAKRLERDPDARIQSLRYFDRAVRGAWKNWQEARGPHFERADAEAPPVNERLETLVARLPGHLPDRNRWVERIRALSGSLPEVERGLEALDAELLTTLRAGLDDEERAAIRDAVTRTLSRASEATGPGDQAGLEEHLFRRELRRRFELPILTLF